MRIFVDGDACPNRNDIINLAKKYSVPIFIYCDFSHEINDNYAHIILCDVGYQNVDMLLVNEVTSGDIVISADYGVATIALSKKAIVIHPSGFMYEDKKILELMEIRHQNMKLRKSKIKIKGPKKRSKLDEEKFLSLLEKVISSN